MDGFRVDDAALGRHAVEIDELTARMRTAARAGAPLGLGAYGLVGQLFAAAAAEATAATSRSVARLAEGAHGLGDGVRATLRGYLDAERRAASRFGTGREDGR
jgi:hypothetical protein